VFSRSEAAIALIAVVVSHVLDRRIEATPPAPRLT